MTIKMGIGVYLMYMEARNSYIPKLPGGRQASAVACCESKKTLGEWCSLWLPECLQEHRFLLPTSRPSAMLRSIVLARTWVH